MFQKFNTLKQDKKKDNHTKIILLCRIRTMREKKEGKKKRRKAEEGKKKRWEKKVTYVDSLKGFSHLKFLSLEIFPHPFSAALCMKANPQRFFPDTHVCKLG